MSGRMNLRRLPKLFRFGIGVALRERLREGYGLGDFKSDLMAGLVVGLVAIPLGMGLAIASGVAPQYGLYTVIVAGFLVALLGGSRFNVTGPTAAFVVILTPVAQKYGLGGLLTAGAMAGVILLVLGVTGLGQAIKMIPHPVTTGFTSGIAVVIATIQLEDFFGLQLGSSSTHFLDRVLAILSAAPSWSLTETAIAVSTLILLLLWPRVSKRVPAPLVALSVVSFAVFLIQALYPSIEVSTIGNQFASYVGDKLVPGIPQSLPGFNWPWVHGSAESGGFAITYDTVEALFPAAIAIALLGAIESLLCAVVADGITQTKHDPDAELIALGTANMITPFFGGIAATGAIARTATNIRFGAQSPIASMIHALVTLVVMILFAPFVAYLPMAAIAALLMLVAYNMSEAKNFIHIIKVAPKGDVAVLICCFVLTVVFDMIVGVTIGVALAALLFMQRMANLSSGKVLEGPFHRLPYQLPKEVVLYEVAGPLFFGAAGRAMSNIHAITDRVEVVIFDLADVPVMDVTGLVAFESAIDRLLKYDKYVILSNLNRQPEALLEKAGVINKEQPNVKVIPSLDHAVSEAMARLSPRN